MLPRLYSEEVLRGVAIDLLKNEKDEKLRKELKEMTIDESLEGSEAQKNKFLAPAPSVPKLDREVAEAHGLQLGLEQLPIPDKLAEEKNKVISETERLKKEKERLQKSAQKSNPMYRSLSQDEVMGYDDEEFFMDNEDEDF